MVVRFFLTVFLMLLGTPAIGCSCMPFERLVEGLRSGTRTLEPGEVLFLGEVSRLIGPPDSGGGHREAEVRVLEVYAGEAASTLNLRALAETTCATAFKGSERRVYRVDASRRIGSCSHEAATPELVSRLQQLKQTRDRRKP